MPPGFTARRWCFPARNRVIAGLAQATIVVEATDRSGSLITADFARAPGRDVGAVPGEVLFPRDRDQCAGFDGALLVRDAGDVLDPSARPPARSPSAPGRRGTWTPTSVASSTRSSAAARPSPPRDALAEARGDGGLLLSSSSSASSAAARPAAVRAAP